MEQHLTGVRRMYSLSCTNLNKTCQFKKYINPSGNRILHDQNDAKQVNTKLTTNARTENQMLISRSKKAMRQLLQLPQTRGKLHQETLQMDEDNIPRVQRDFQGEPSGHAVEDDRLSHQR